MAGPSRAHARIFVIALASVAATVRARAGDAREPAAGVGPSAFAGASACARCHGAADAAWARSNHARSTVEAKDGELPTEARAGGTVIHAPGVSTFHAMGDGAVVETTGPDGKPTTYPLSYVVGRRRLRMYVTTLPTGPLQVLPFMREEETGNWFDYTHLIFGAPDRPPDRPPTVSPGDPSFWTGPVRSFDANCTRCHVSGGTAVAPSADGGGRRSTWRALGVDCEACHGPLAGHAALWRDPPRGAVHDSVSRLGAAERSASLGLCLSCHLEGRPVASAFGPGDDIFEFVDPTLLDERDRVDPAGRPLELIYEGLSLLVSRCAESGGLTCVTCHAPHGSGHGASLVASPAADGLCSTCHARIAAAPGKHAHHRADGIGARCVPCHMPKVPVERGHGVVTDHTIGVPDPFGIPGVEVARDACTGCHAGARGFPQGAPAVSAPELQRAYSAWWPRAERRPPWARRLVATDDDRGRALRTIEAMVRDSTLPRVVRASAATLLGRMPGADPATLLSGARDPDSLVRRAFVGALARLTGEDIDSALAEALVDVSPGVRDRAARAVLEGFTRCERNLPLARAAIPVLEASAAVAPNDDLRWSRLAAARQIVGDFAGAVEAYERQCALDPFANAARATLATLRARLGKSRR